MPPPRPPMPSEPELERRFNEVLIQMDLPPERAKILKGFSNEKKWDTVCDHDLVHAKAVCGNMILKQVFRSVFDPGFFADPDLKARIRFLPYYLLQLT